MHREINPGQLDSALCEGEVPFIIMWTTPQTRQKEEQWSLNHFVPCVDIQSISKPQITTPCVLSFVGEPSQILSTTCSTISDPVLLTQTQHQQEAAVSVTQQANVGHFQALTEIGSSLITSVYPMIR